MTPKGEIVANSHDIGERISWTLRPIVSTKLNMVIYEDGFKEDYPHTRNLPEIGSEVQTVEKVVENGDLVSREVPRTVSRIVTWDERRERMKGVCLNCHNDTYVDNFYKQFDDLVVLYNEKFAVPAKKFIDDLAADGVIDPMAPFEKEVQWVFWELWHHEGRRARHGASMMGPDYTHWHGMYEVGKHFYMEFLPAVIKAASEHSTEMERMYRDRVNRLLQQEEHLWLQGLSPEKAKAVQEMYKRRYDE